MIFYKYNIRWKKYQDILSQNENAENEFKKHYSRSFLMDMNDTFYNDYHKTRRYLTIIIDRIDNEIELYISVDIKFFYDSYEKEIRSMFSDCDVISYTETTVEEFRKKVMDSPCVKSPRAILAELGIDYQMTYYNPVPFKIEEIIKENRLLSKKECEIEAKRILASKSFLEELERIYSVENRKEYYGHPVHYMISAGNSEAAREIYALLLNALFSNKRILSNRAAILRKVQSGAYRDERFKQVIEAASGAVVVIELMSEGARGRFATDFYEFTKQVGNILEHEKKDTLFILVEITGSSLNDMDAISNILNKADIIQIAEGNGTKKEAEKYLLELADKVDLPIDDKTDILDYLAEKASYSVTDIYKAYNSWYGSGIKDHIYKAYKNQKKFKIEVTKVKPKPYEELQNMIGLNEVKKVVDQIIAASKVKKVRERMGLKTEGTSLHMLYTGNPGTGKTIIARLLAQILKEEDVIKSGCFIECGRQDLVGKYVGHTAPLIEQNFRAAVGGILFIDEAYSLVDDSNTYGAEAINCITQLMENYRESVIVIFAGYPDRMEKFINQNEGLKSRIGFYLDFPDYTESELIDILKLMAEKREYIIEEAAIKACRDSFADIMRKENYGNGRWVRNILEKAILNQSCRIIKESDGKELLRDDLCILKKEDFVFERNENEKLKRKYGFAV